MQLTAKNLKDKMPITFVANGVRMKGKIRIKTLSVYICNDMYGNELPPDEQAIYGYSSRFHLSFFSDDDFTNRRLKQFDVRNMVSDNGVPLLDEEDV